MTSTPDTPAVSERKKASRASVLAQAREAERQALMQEYVAAYRRANDGAPVVIEWDRGWYRVRHRRGSVIGQRYRKSEIEQMIRRLQARV